MLYRRGPLYLTGLSMGGIGSFDSLPKHPETLTGAPTSDDVMIDWLFNQDRQDRKTAPPSFPVTAPLAAVGSRSTPAFVSTHR